MIEFDLNANDCEALIRHYQSFVPAVDDQRDAALTKTGWDSSKEADRTHSQVRCENPVNRCHRI